MTILLLIILVNLGLSLISLAIAFLLSRNEALLEKITIPLVSLSAGTLLGGAFLHLLPEATEHSEIETVSTIVMLSIIVFLGLEKFLNWRHCHKDECDIHSFGYMNLVGDGVHNFLDGMIIASSFVVDARLGFATAFAIALHEIPQEIGDFGVLIHSGMGKARAILSNVLISLTSLIGGILGYFLSELVHDFEYILLAVAAGGFIYIATSDLIPEIRGKENRGRMLISFLILCFGIFLMTLVSDH